MRRTQLYLEEDLWKILHAQARSRKTTVSNLVREALRERYTVNLEKRRRAMQAIVGMWADREDIGDGVSYVRRLRRDTRMKRLGLE